VLLDIRFMYSDDGPKRPKHVLYVKIHSCVGRYLTLYLCTVEKPKTSAKVFLCVFVF